MHRPDVLAQQRAGERRLARRSCATTARAGSRPAAVTASRPADSPSARDAARSSSSCGRLSRAPRGSRDTARSRSVAPNARHASRRSSMRPARLESPCIVARYAASSTSTSIRRPAVSFALRLAARKHCARDFPTSGRGGQVEEPSPRRRRRPAHRAARTPVPIPYATGSRTRMWRRAIPTPPSDPIRAPSSACQPEDAWAYGVSPAASGATSHLRRGTALQAREHAGSRAGHDSAKRRPRRRRQPHKRPPSANTRARPRRAPPSPPSKWIQAAAGPPPVPSRQRRASIAASSAGSAMPVKPTRAVSAGARGRVPARLEERALPARAVFKADPADVIPGDQAHAIAAAPAWNRRLL